MHNYLEIMRLAEYQYNQEYLFQWQYQYKILWRHK